MTRKPELRQSWWQTLPGILTALAAVIVAIAGLVPALKGRGAGESQQIGDESAQNAGDSETKSTPPIVSQIPVVRDWASWLSGKWCGPAGTSWTWAVQTTGEHEVQTTADNKPPPQDWKIVDTRNDTFEISSTADPSQRLKYERLSENSFHLLKPLGAGYRQGTFRRCP